MDKFDDIDRDRNLHITNFGWSKIIDIANIISEKFDGCKIQPSDKVDDVQLNKKNDPDTHMLDFWSPRTSLSDGINKIIKRYN